MCKLVPKTLWNLRRGGVARVHGVHSLNQALAVCSARHAAWAPIQQLESGRPTCPILMLPRSLSKTFAPTTAEPNPELEATCAHSASEETLSMVPSCDSRSWRGLRSNVQPLLAVTACALPPVNIQRHINIYTPTEARHLATRLVGLHPCYQRFRLGTLCRAALAS